MVNVLLWFNSFGHSIVYEIWWNVFFIISLTYEVWWDVGFECTFMLARFKLHLFRTLILPILNNRLMIGQYPLPNSRININIFQISILNSWSVLLSIPPLRILTNLWLKRTFFKLLRFQFLNYTIDVLLLLLLIHTFLLLIILPRLVISVHHLAHSSWRHEPWWIRFFFCYIFNDSLLVLVVCIVSIEAFLVD